MPRTPRKTLLATTIVGLALLAGCKTTKTVYVPDGEPLRLAEPVTAYVWIDADGDGVLEKTQNRLTIPEGWWAIPDIGEPVPTTQPTR